MFVVVVNLSLDINYLDRKALQWKKVNTNEEPCRKQHINYITY